jgi:type VI protein secretion system component VasK
MYNDVLQPVLQKQGTSYQYVPGDVRLTPEFVRFFNRAASFSELLVPNGAQDPSLRIRVAPILTEGTNATAVTIEGQTIQTTKQLSGKQFMDWPGANHEAKLSVQLGTLSATLVGPYSGPWAMFQLFYAADSWQQIADTSRAEFVLRSGTQGISLPGGGALKVSVDVSPARAATILKQSFFSPGMECVSQAAP